MTNITPTNSNSQISNVDTGNNDGDTTGGDTTSGGDTTGGGDVTDGSDTTGGGDVTDGGDTTDGGDEQTPVEKTYTLTSTLNDGDLVIVYNNYYKKALSQEGAGSFYRKGESVTVEEGSYINTANENVVWKVKKTENGFYLLNSLNQKLSCSNNNNNLIYDGDNADWTYFYAYDDSDYEMFLCSFDKTDSDDNWYAVEWYASKNDFTTYRFDENSDYNMYLVSFYAIKNQNGEQIYDYFYGFDEGGNEGEDEGAVIRDQEFSDFDYKGLPTTGKPKALVVPVQFSDDKFTTKELADLKLAFNGTSEQTGYESVNSYYKASSYGNLDIQFDVFDVFTYEGSVEDFETEYFYYELMPDEYYSPLETILTKLFETYDDTVDFSTYDNDKDGYIDSIYYVYSAGYSDDTDDNFWWAWTDMYAYETDVADNVEGCYYVWASVDFIYDSIVEADAENGVSEVKVNVNAVTYIHETGHLLMLDDYYDYDTTQGPVGGIGGGDMMDCNIGDHNSFSKIILGWTKPIEVTTTQTVTISSINDSSKTTNNCIILRKDNTTATAQNAYNAEYLLIDLYAPIGLNRLTNGIMGYPNQTAVRIYHVDANLGIYYTDEYNNTYFGYMCDNGTTKDKLIKLLEADGDNSIEKVTTENQGCGDLAKMSDYYIAGSKMPTTYKWNDGSAIKYQIEVTSIDSVNNTATISVIVG